MKQRYELILAGSGGQGLVLIARLLGSAAILEDKNVAQTQSMLGDSQRGGLIVAELIIDSEEIIFQQVEQPDIILALGDMSIKKYGMMPARILFLYESGLADLGQRNDLFPVPFAELASERGYAANMIALGMIITLAGPVTLDSLEKTLRQSISAESAAKNFEAVLYGTELAAEMRAKRIETV
jgi:2-oxoglutarate ferredoxin oxidoreductase subunit gamma